MLCQCFLPAVSMPGSADLSTHPCRRGNLLALTPLWHIPLLEQDRMTSVAVHRLIFKVLWAATVDQELDANGDTTQGCVNGSKQDSVAPDPKDTSAGNCRAVHSSPWHFYSCKQTDCSSSEPHCSSFFCIQQSTEGNITFLKIQVAQNLLLTTKPQLRLLGFITRICGLLSLTWICKHGLLSTAVCCDPQLFITVQQRQPSPSLRATY